MRALLIIAALAAALSTNAMAETANPAAPGWGAGWVASAHGANVHADASNGSRIVAVLSAGARVFVREIDGDFARIDGYGVAGYAYVRRAYVTDAPPAPAALQAAAAQQALPSLPR